MADHSVRISGDPWNPRVEMNGHDISAEDALTEFGWTPPNACAGGCR